MRDMVERKSRALATRGGILQKIIIDASAAHGGSWQKKSTGVYGALGKSPKKPLPPLARGGSSAKNLKRSADASGEWGKF